MENRNEPMSAETPKQWGDAHGWNLGEVTLYMMQQYADYIESFQPDNSVAFAEWYHNYKMSCYKGKLSGYSDDRNATELYSIFLNKKDRK